MLFRLIGRESAQMVSDGRDNRDVLDVAENQKLSTDEIEELKAKAEDGQMIVEALIENSETYEKKTEFAQEKYLTKKIKKYCTTFSALKPTASTICEARTSRHSLTMQVWLRPSLPGHPFDRAS